MSSKGKKGKQQEEVKVEVKKVELKELPEGQSLFDDLGKRQAFKKFSWRGDDINKLINMKKEDLK